MSKSRNERRDLYFRADCKKDVSSVHDDNTTKDIVEKLKEVSLNSEQAECFFDEFQFKKTDKKFEPSTEISGRSKGVKKLPNLSKLSTKRRKKKNSFIVSDSSVTDEDGVTLYHRILTERIKEDVQKLTPRRSAKSKITEDNGIFTPYIIRRRSDWSDSDFSDKENVDCDNTPVERKQLKNDSIGSKSSSDLEKSTDSFKSARSESSPIVHKPFVTDLKEKERSWCFSDRETFEESEIEIKKNIRESSPIVAPRRKNSISTTPITFRLNNLKKHTPTPQRLCTPDDLLESWLFLRSLSTYTGTQHIHPETEQYKKKFKKMKEQLAEKLFKLFNEDIFENKLPSDIKIEWNGRMRSTSGFCYNKRLKNIVGPNNECLRTSRIVLSTKIVETPERLRDTLIHEMCHAAAWIIDNKADGHGRCWKSWVSKVHRKFPELPPVKTCHDYSIKTKFKYRCVNCGYTIGRHSKSLNLERKRCGYCYGKFELLLHNELKSTAFGNSPKNVKVKPLSKFALFVKENYGKTKSENADLKHGEIMKILSKNFADTKNLD